MPAAEPVWLPALRRAVGGRRVGAEVRWLASTPSTNDAARDWLDRGGPDGLVVIAGRQTAGRGRRGRGWASPAARGLYLSAGLRPDLAGGAAARLMLLGGVAAAEAIRGLGLTAEIRWPNDIDVAGRKIAGVLSESRLERGRVTSSVLGIGINLRHRAADFPTEAEGIATSFLLELGAAPAEAALAGALLERLDAWYARLGATAAGPDALLERWKELAPGHRGAGVQVEGEGQRIVGVTCGLAPDGALLVQPEDGPLRAVRVGEVVRARQVASGDR